MNAPAPRPAQPETSAPTALPDAGSRPWLSALADGDVSAVQQACDAWRHDAQARADWHTYHLIGDVLRSEDLAARPERDAQFLARLRQRLADEPVVLAPAPAEAGAQRQRRAAWLVPLAAAAGVAAVAGVLVLAQTGPEPAAPGSGWALNSPAAAPQAVRANEPPLGSLASAGGPPAAAGAGTVGNASARMVRDARLDHYLEAHRGALGAAVAVPGGAMRNAEVIVPAAGQR